MTPVESDEEDLTRKQRREQARAQRKAMEEAAASGEMRRRRLGQLGVVVAVVVVAIVVIAVIASGGGGKSGLAKSSTEQQKVTGEVTSLIGGIPQSGNSIGSPSAPVTIQYFGDLECPICREFTLGALPAIMQKWVRTGKVRIEYRSLETATREPETFRTQQIAALAAGKQNKMWNFVELFYHEQGKEDSEYVNEAYLEGLARQVPGLDLASWHKERNEGNLGKVVEEDAQAAGNEGFNGTPSFLIGHSGGALKKLEYTSLTETGSFDKAIEAALKG